MRKLLPILVVFITASLGTRGQCGAGYTSAGVNWSALEYFPTAGYTDYPLSASMSPNQSFAFGKNRMTITYSGCTSLGENILRGGGTKDEVQYVGNGTITLSFATPVTNLSFSLYDIDDNQSVTFSATNSGTPTAVTLTPTATPTLLTISGATATYDKAVKNDLLTASVNVAVAGPVTSVTMTVSGIGSGGGADKNYWLSDITGCVTGSFPTNYYAVSKPPAGMPSYVLVAVNSSVYMVDPATGRAKFVFSDGASSGTINSLAYDPYNKVAYFCWSLTNNGSATASSRILRKYDFTTGVFSTIANDVTTIGLPTFSQGTESGAAAFYDGALYLGIEGGQDDGNGGGRTKVSRESIIWRLDFNGSGNPTITQAYAVDGDAHDWSDFSINDGMLYDFNGDAATPDYHHYNLQTGANQKVNYVGVTPKQSAVGWDGTIYWQSNTIAPYSNGSVGTQRTITATPGIPNWSNSGAPSWGDAAEAFRPAGDYGDAPISYDLNLTAPAVHETVANLRLGATTDVEWDKLDPGTGATFDGNDEDGLPFVTILNQGGNYVTTVNAFNNTGAPATLVAWLDINGNGAFDMGEGRSTPVPTGTGMQSFSLVWGSTVTDIPNNSYTYLRIRITSASNNMSTSNPTGYFPDGEVEDYRVLVTTSTLAVKLTEFGARKTSNGQVGIQWSVADEEASTAYELQRSANGQHYEPIHSTAAAQKNATSSYRHMDAVPHQGENYYRLKITEPNGAVKYSAVSKVVLEHLVRVTLAPNPAAGSVRLSVQAEVASPASVRLVDLNSRTVYEKTFHAAPGVNQLTVPLEGLMPGLYQAEVWIGSNRYTQSLVVKK